MNPLFTALQPATIAELDRVALERYNQTATEQYRLRPELGPYAFEGDLENAQVALLLSNPGYSEDSPLNAHTFRREGWPISAIHEDAPLGTRAWNRRLLKGLIQQTDALTVSRRVVKLELTPWASHKMDKGLCLPSRAHILKAAAELASRGVTLVVMRAEALWLQEPMVAACTRRYRVNNFRCASVSAGNLNALAWAEVCEAVKEERGFRSSV